MENNKDINDEKLNLLRQKFKDSISHNKNNFWEKRV